MPIRTPSSSLSTSWNEVDLVRPLISKVSCLLQSVVLPVGGCGNVHCKTPVTTVMWTVSLQLFSSSYQILLVLISNSQILLFGRWAHAPKRKARVSGPELIERVKCLGR